MDIQRYKAGTYTRQYQYRSFSPTRINHNWTWSDPKINTLLERANLKLGELNAFSLHVPDVDIFIRMHVIKEATTSSRIEGTRTEVDEVVLRKQDLDPERRDDWQEVHNHVNAMNHAIKRLNVVPLSTRLLKETHKILMTGVRGRTKHPGEYRTSQNWIGGATINDAVFIPPHHSEVSGLMGDLKNFLHNEEIDVPDIIRIAIAHYQFETIHPFLDGNGRLGRLLVTLYLASNGVLQRPTLYLSAYLEKHKSLYYDNLMKVRASNDLLQWVKFFLVGVTETSQKGIVTFRKILDLKEDIERKRLITLGKKLPRAEELLSILYRKPSITSAEVEAALNISPKTANLLLQDFARLGILQEATGGRRNRIFRFDEYLRLFA